MHLEDTDGQAIQFGELLRTASWTVLNFEHSLEFFKYASSDEVLLEVLLKVSLAPTGLLPEVPLKNTVNWANTSTLGFVAALGNMMVESMFAEMRMSVSSTCVKFKDEEYPDSNKTTTFHKKETFCSNSPNEWWALICRSLTDSARKGHDNTGVGAMMTAGGANLIAPASVKLESKASTISPPLEISKIELNRSRFAGSRSKMKVNGCGQYT